MASSWRTVKVDAAPPAGAAHTSGAARPTHFRGTTCKFLGTKTETDCKFLGTKNDIKPASILHERMVQGLGFGVRSTELVAKNSREGHCVEG